MELCIAESLAISPSKSILFTFPSKSSQWRPSSYSFRTFNCPIGSGLHFHKSSSLRSSISDDKSSSGNAYVKDEPDRFTPLDDTQSIEKINYEEIDRGKKLVDDSSENQFQKFEFLDKLDLKIDSEDTYSILLLGGGGLITVYLAISVVGAIDSVPLVPKLLEVVGLSYMVWFVTRYLLFKKNREELAVKIEELKKQVLG